MAKPETREQAIERAHNLFCQMTTAKKGLEVAFESLFESAKQAVIFTPQYVTQMELIAWVEKSPHKGFCSRYGNNKENKCGCGRDELIAKAKGEE